MILILFVGLRRQTLRGFFDKLQCGRENLCRILFLKKLDKYIEVRYNTLQFDISKQDSEECLWTVK